MCVCVLGSVLTFAPLLSAHKALLTPPPIKLIELITHSSLSPYVPHCDWLTFVWPPVLKVKGLNLGVADTS